MFYGNTIQDTRQMFFVSWQKYNQKKPLLPVEQQLIDVILRHPEYHILLSSGDAQSSYFPELGQSNPFLHMGLHLTIRDQVATNRPFGITTAFQQLLKKHTDAHTVEHLIMEPLAECLWHAQRNQGEPDEAAYLIACRQL
ncbi:MAG: DUF1841 family protein [Legionellaceae bacterium]|nr:DUF1841 family protein [Legionellaceae bacterium]